MLTIDGSQGEGGGQVLRTSLSLALTTDQAFKIRKIRGGRKRPGLHRQHLTCVRAAQTLSSAEVAGEELGAQDLTFSPRKLEHGNHCFSVGSAGSAALVLQTVLTPLLVTPGTSELIFEGGTHNPFAPPFDFLARVFFPLLRKMGATIEARLERHGFYPAGGGRFVIEVSGGKLRPLELLDRGALVSMSARALVANLPRKIGEREVEIARRKLGLSADDVSIESVASPGPGNALMLEAKFENGHELVTGFGEKGITAERVAKRTVRALQAWLEADVPVGQHLADQLMLPMALGGGGRMRTSPLSLHATTNLEVMKSFLPNLTSTVREEMGSAIVTLQV